LDRQYAYNDRLKVFVRISTQNDEKHNSAKRIIEENRVTDYLCYITDDTNVILARAEQLFRLRLDMVDDNDNPSDNVVLDKSARRFLSKYADPIAVSDFVKPLCEKIDFANRKMLKSFKLKLVVEPPEEGRREA
jgi:hypothetical protein